MKQLFAFIALTKPRVVMLIVFTALIGMFLATPHLPPWQLVLWASTGIWLAAASAAALNHLLDQRADALMARTSDRPLPKGTLTSRQVLIFSIVLCALSMVILTGLVNVLTAALTFASLIGYAIIYTTFLKRATPQNIVIGGAAGAAPPVLGWTAITNSIDPYALLLFLIIFIWTPPHFWALAIYRRHDYAKAEIPMLPVAYGVVFTRWHVLLYTILLTLVTLLPYVTGMSGFIYLGSTIVLNMGFLYYALQLMRPPSEQFAMKVFQYSILYLMALFVFLLLDHYLTKPLLTY